MNYKIELTEQAELDLINLYEYLALTLQEPKNAGGQLNRLESAILTLDHMPERFKKYEKEPWHSKGLRMLPVDNFVVLYLPDLTAGTVTVIRIMYSGRDIETELEKHTKGNL